MRLQVGLRVVEAVRRLRIVGATLTRGDDPRDATLTISGGGGGVSSHPLLTSLGWTSSGHTGTDGRLAGWASGSPALVDPGSAGFRGQVGTGTADTTTFLRGDGSWQLPAYDPWQTVTLGSDFNLLSTTQTAVTGLAFTPSASTTYLIELWILIKTAGAAAGTRPGIDWPTGLSHQGAWVMAPSTATTVAQRNWGPTTAGQAAIAAGATTTADFYLAVGRALMVVGGSPSGNFQITVSGESGAVQATIGAGSTIRYLAL